MLIELIYSKIGFWFKIKDNFLFLFYLFYIHPIYFFHFYHENNNPQYWGGGDDGAVLIIKGKIVVPKPEKVVEKLAIE